MIMGSFRIIVFLGFVVSLNAQSTNELTEDLNTCTRVNDMMLVLPMLEKIASSLQLVENKLELSEKLNERNQLELAEMFKVQERNGMEINALNALGGNLSNSILALSQQMRHMTAIITQVGNVNSENHVKMETKLREMQADVRGRIDGVVARTESIETMHRNSTSELSQMKQIQSNDTLKLQQLDSRISAAQIVIQNIKESADRQLSSIKTLPALYGNLSRLVSAQENGNTALSKLSSELEFMKTEYSNSHDNTTASLIRILKNSTEEISLMMNQINIGDSISAVTSQMGDMAKTFVDGIVTKMDKLQSYNEIIKKNVSVLTSTVNRKLDSIQRESIQIKHGLGIIENDLLQNNESKQATSRQIEKVIGLISEDSDLTTNFIKLFENVSQSDNELKDQIMHELSQLETVNTKSKETSEKVLALQIMTEKKFSNLLSGLRNVSKEDLNLTSNKLKDMMTEINRQNGDLKSELKKISFKGDLQKAVLENIIHRIQSVKEHVQATHDNVTAILDNISEKTKNISGILSPEDDGNKGTRESPAKSCILLKGKPSGKYWIKPEDGPSAKTFEVYCDMETDGGGWTLVYSYTFARYSSFSSGQNAVTPRPSWPVTWSSTRMVPSSTTTPLSETSYGAMDFRLWRRIGSEFLVKSNIGNWLKCSEDGGSLVHGRPGTLSCGLVKRLVTTCSPAIPRFLKWDAVGPYICSQTGGQIYFWDGSKTSIYPTHDPCGNTASFSRFSSIRNPHGNIYIR